MPRLLDWLVVGGGIHGCHLAVRLLAEGVARRGTLRIVDPRPGPLALWRLRGERTGMGFLRSNVVHHLGIQPMALAEFGDRYSPRGHFRGPYRRPSLELFNRHARRVCQEWGLAELWIQGSCQGLRPRRGGGWWVTLAEAEWEGWGSDRATTVRGRGDGVHRDRVVAARNVVLALGPGGDPAWPGWARALRRAAGEERVLHVLDEAPELPVLPMIDPRDDAPDLVVGGGLSAGQVALRLHDAGRPVILLHRAPLREEPWDADPGWFGPREMDGFQALRDPDQRRAIIGVARHRGTVTPEIHRAIRATVRRGTLQALQGEVVKACFEPPLASGEGGGNGPEAASGSPLRLVVRATGETQTRTVRPARVILATGFGCRRPGGEWLDEVVEGCSLQVASCGHPVPGPDLQWGPGLFVSGALADLELGPTSRNIHGARVAARRILAPGDASRRGGMEAALPLTGAPRRTST